MYMKILLWFDDWRNPFESFGDYDCLKWHEIYNRQYFHFDSYDVVWVKTYQEFVSWISVNGIPAAICFDHDIDNEYTGMDAVKWLVNYCIDKNLDLPMYATQSGNPVGRENMISYLDNFNKFKKNNINFMDNDDFKKQIEEYAYNLPHSAEFGGVCKCDIKSKEATKYGWHHYWEYNYVMMIACEAYRLGYLSKELEIEKKQ